ncbi:discoidin domain-containing protein [Paenibacillus sp. p3-SID1389]|uniref:discoidin domain-containing protein n=1 Tax=Paenibacillus sp. p3-SID1389 TaxID=2916364 RepID=UPI0021A4A136|nr:glycosyl hydrolase family 28-related protein [Paenibacillus sp. p3-SID1389]MCT2196848.1 discoidin domain-containing protein [Paenibacillus sp. p3-SID1389]
MRKRWSAILLALAVVAGLTVTGGGAISASADEANPAAHQGPSLGRDGRSLLYPKGWYPGYRTSEGQFLHDFSYAGYRRGEVPIPSVNKHRGINVTKSPYRADPTGRTDSTRAIQQAIDDAAARGGGVVYLPKGTYRVTPQEGKDFALNINSSGVVLKGDGQLQTHIYNAQENMKQKDIIRVGGGDWKRTSTSSKLRKTVSEPTVLLPVESTDGFQVDDFVVITFETTEGFLKEHGMQNKWASRLGKVEPIFYRQIVAVDSKAKTLTLDIPTRYPLKLRDDITITKTEAPIMEVGLEDFSIANVENSKPGLGEDDFKVEGTAGYEADNAESVFWNTKGIAAHSSKPGIIIESEQFGNGYIIGTHGKVNGVKVDIIGSIPNADTSPFDWVEAVGQGERLFPQSLYKDQTKQRLDHRELGLQSILVNGEAVPGVQFLRTQYDYVLPYGTTETPILSAKATSKDARVKIVQPKGTSGTGVITITRRGKTQTVRVKFSVAKTPVLPENITIAPDKSVPGWSSAGYAISAGKSGRLQSFLTLDNGEVVNTSELNIPVTYRVSDEQVGYIEGNTFYAERPGVADIIASCQLQGVVVEARQTFEVLEPIPEPAGPLAAIAKVTASADDGNVPSNTLDRDPDTRWSADGKGQFLQVELEEVTIVDGVGLWFYNGHTRSNYFDLEVSVDGVHFESVLTGMASKKQSELETFEFTPTPAKYIRYVGQGNEINTWNSLLEIWVHAE